ncbi:MAG: SRPBCC domain-containing protein [Bacteroidetes bacterium]|nr:SRPBCC domain-containing protein [Bacteroidota bacterium]
MNNTEPVIKEVTIDAPVSKVWKAITEKEQIAEWLMPSNDFELKAGTTFHMTGSSKGVEYPHICTITEIVPEKKLSYTWAVKDKLSDTLVTYELEEQDGKTKVTLTHSGWDKVTLNTVGATREDYNNGWNHVLPGLQKYVEAN